MASISGPSTTFATQTHTTKVWYLDSIINRYSTTATRYTIQACARYCGHIIILLLCNQPHLDMYIELTFNMTDAWHNTSAWCISSITCWHPHTSVCHHQKPCQQHDFSGTLRCELSLRTWQQKRCWWTHFLANNNSNAPNNGAILTLSAIIWHVVSSASKAALAVPCTIAKMQCPYARH